MITNSIINRNKTSSIVTWKLLISSRAGPTSTRAHSTSGRRNIIIRRVVRVECVYGGLATVELQAETHSTVKQGNLCF